MPQNSTISNLPEDTSVTIADYVAIVTPGLGQTRKAKLSSILALATGAGAPNYVGKYISLSALQTTIPTGVDGNYAIVTASPDDEEYIWDSDHSAWVKTANIPAGTFAGLGGNATDNGSLAAALTARDNAISAEASTRDTNDAAIQSQVSALSAALIPHPTYTAPTAGISSSQSTGGLEIGQTINIPLTAVFNQNNGGSSTGLSIKKNGTQISTSSPYTDSGVVMSATPVVYNCNFTYGQGPILNNILGIPDATGRIAANSSPGINSGNLSFQGQYKVFFGATDTVINAGNVRTALANSVFVSGATVDFPSGNAAKNFYIWVPPGHSLNTWIDSTAFGADLKAPASNSSITIADAGSGTMAGTLWRLALGAPYPGSGDLLKFQIA